MIESEPRLAKSVGAPGGAAWERVWMKVNLVRADDILLTSPGDCILGGDPIWGEGVVIETEQGTNQQVRVLWPCWPGILGSEGVEGATGFYERLVFCVPTRLPFQRPELVVSGNPDELSETVAEERQRLGEISCAFCNVPGKDQPILWMGGDLPDRCVVDTMIYVQVREGPELHGITHERLPAKSSCAPK